MFNPNSIRGLFPSLDTKVMGNPLIYLDNTATTQTPSFVIDDIVDSYLHRKANVHRGVHTLSQEATARQEKTRKTVKEFINAGSTEEIIFTQGTTESINLVASSYGQLIPEGSEIILTVMEHHANIVPWQLLQKRKNLKIRVVEINERGELNLEQYKSLFSEKTALAAFCHVSNVLGTINPVKEMTRIAHEHNVKVLIDGAQATSHIKVDVQDIDCDFYAFSAHKMYGPTGVGILYGKKELLEAMPPYQGGGEMISRVSFEGTTFAELPFKFEAGTPDFVGIAAFSKALEFLKPELRKNIDNDEEIHPGKFLDEIEHHELHLLSHIEKRMEEEIPAVRIFGRANEKSAVLSFLLGDQHPYDVGMLLDGFGVAVRTGHHCAQPLMDFLGIPGTVRAGIACYNILEEADFFIESLKKVAKILHV